MSSAIASFVALAVGIAIGWCLSGAAVVRVEPMVKCDLQRLYGEAWSACRAKGDDYMLSDTVGQDNPPRLKCVGTHETEIHLKELAQ